MHLWTCTLVHLTRRIENVTRWLICVHLSPVLMSNVNIVNGDCGEMFGIWQNIFLIAVLLYIIFHFYVYRCLIYMYFNISWFSNHKMCLCFMMWLRVLCSSFQKQWIIVKRSLFNPLFLCMPLFANIFIKKGTWRAQTGFSERPAINTKFVYSKHSAFISTERHLHKHVLYKMIQTSMPSLPTPAIITWKCLVSYIPLLL